MPLIQADREEAKARAKGWTQSILVTRNAGLQDDLPALHVIRKNGSEYYTSFDAVIFDLNDPTVQIFWQIGPDSHDLLIKGDSDEETYAVRVRRPARYL